MKRLFYLLASAAMTLLASSCIGGLSFPGTVTYKVEASDDVLSLFNVEVSYLGSAAKQQSTTIRYSPWTYSLLMEDGFKGEMTVTLKAKEAAITGSGLIKDSYNMSITPDIVLEKNLQGSFTVNSTKSGEKNTTFAFKVPNSSNVSVDVAPLKFNKHFVFCFSVDDSYENGWSKVFALINGKWIDDLEFFHKGLNRTTGYQPDHTLCVTDGCGNDRRFTFGEAIWPNISNSFNPQGLIIDVNRSEYSPYISWEELQVMTDMGNAVYWHNVNTADEDESVVSEIIAGLEEDYDKTMSKLSYPMKVLAQPDGNPSYLEAGFQSPLVYMTRTTSLTERFKDVYLLTEGSLYKLEVFGSSSIATIEETMEELHKQAVSDNPILISMLAHRPGEEYMDMLRDLYKLYGKAGDDNLWMTSYDELYEYFEQRSKMSVKKSIEGNYAVFEITVPNDDKFMYNELSFIVKNASGTAQPVSDNIYGFSSAVQDDGTVLVNCNFSDRNYKLAEKYVSKYEDEYDPEDKEYAEYLISLLREDLRGRLISRLDNVKEPTEADFPVNGVYTKKEMKYYIKYNNGHTITVEQQF